MTTEATNIHELEELYNRTHVFRDREHAGEILASMLEKYRNTHALILGIPAGGVPVAAVISRILNLSLDVVVAKKITPPWNTEFGYGAVAFDGTVHFNEAILPQLNLSETEITKGAVVAKSKVDKRTKLFRQNKPFPDVTNRPIILVDDGLATGITYRTAIKALRNLGAAEIVGATPTGHGQSVKEISKELDALYCANIRTGLSYAVADAYEKWYDVPEKEVMEILRPTVKSAVTH